MPENQPNPVAQLSARLNQQWPTIQIAADAADVRAAALEHALAQYTTEDTTIVVFGSMARREFTVGSDIDWIVLVDGSASAEHLDASLKIEAHLNDKELKGPGTEATFGGLVFSHDLIHYIGGDSDSNANHTRRMLLLLESRPIGRDDAYRRVVNNILKRYIVEDFGWAHGRNPMHVPRFLQNDIARYWRTLAVDFAYKRRQRAGHGWGLRTAKLRMSRKLTYAAGLLMCYSCALEPEIRELDHKSPDAALAIVAHLARYADRTPLDIFARLFLERAHLAQAAKAMFNAYDGFLAILHDPDKRARLDSIAADDVEHDEIYQRVRELSHSFQAGLDDVFLSPTQEPEFFKLTKAYGVF